MLFLARLFEIKKIMRKTNSLKALKIRDRNCKLVKRKGRVYIINKIKARFKARQG